VLDTVIHRWLHIPYSLNVRYVKRPKKPRASVLFIHGIGNTGDAWKEVIAQLPDDVQIISIDLLGFGDSPNPSWALYNAKTQARSVLTTYLKLRLTAPITIVGHSLGALVAIEVAKRYPLIVRSLVLCSPPLYITVQQSTRLPSSDSLLRQLYASARERPENFVKLSAIAMKYDLINTSFNVTPENIASYMATLEAMIINQTSLQDAQKLTVPTTIIRGTLDPWVVTKNLKQLSKHNHYITLRSIIAGHEVRGRYVAAVVDTVVGEFDKR